MYMWQILIVTKSSDIVGKVLRSLWWLTYSTNMSVPNFARSSANLSLELFKCFCQIFFMLNTSFKWIYISRPLRCHLLEYSGWPIMSKISENVKNICELTDEDHHKITLPHISSQMKRRLKLQEMCFYRRMHEYHGLNVWKLRKF